MHMIYVYIYIYIYIHSVNDNSNDVMWRSVMLHILYYTMYNIILYYNIPTTITNTTSICPIQIVHTPVTYMSCNCMIYYNITAGISKQTQEHVQTNITCNTTHHTH